MVWLLGVLDIKMTHRSESAPPWPKVREFKTTPAAPSRIWQNIWRREWLHVLPKTTECLTQYSGLMFQVLKQLIALFVLCVILKQSFAFFSPFWDGGLKHMENQCRWIQYSLHCPLVLSYGSVFLSYLRSSYQIFVALRPLPWNVWTLSGPQCGVMTLQCVIILIVMYIFPRSIVASNGATLLSTFWDPCFLLSTLFLFVFFLCTVSVKPALLADENLRPNKVVADSRSQATVGGVLDSTLQPMLWTPLFCLSFPNN